MDENKRFQEMALRAAYTGRTQFTRFLEPASEAQAAHLARQAGAEVCFFGGYEGAERKLAAFYADVPPQEYPVAALQIHWNEQFSTAGHRDLLGSLMALGVERDTTGDICMGRAPGTAYLFCVSEMADYLVANWTSAGRTAIRVRRAEALDIAPPEGSTKRVTVQQLRLDAVVAAGYRLYRAEAQRLIAAGLVKRNHVEELRADIRLEAGDLLSVRGYGRLKLMELEGETRRGRIALTVLLYGK